MSPPPKARWSHGNSCRRHSVSLLGAHLHVLTCARAIAGAWRRQIQGWRHAPAPDSDVRCHRYGVVGAHGVPREGLRACVSARVRARVPVCVCARTTCAVLCVRAHWPPTAAAREPGEAGHVRSSAPGRAQSRVEKRGGPLACGADSGIAGAGKAEATSAAAAAAAIAAAAATVPAAQIKRRHRRRRRRPGRALAACCCAAHAGVLALNCWRRWRQRPARRRRPRSARRSARPFARPCAPIERVGCWLGGR